MKYLCPTFIAAMLLCCWQEGLSQGFVNLNFEAANLSGYSPGSTVPATNAFPGWVVNAGYILYDNVSLSGGSISIIDTNWVDQPIQGNYHALLASFNPGIEYSNTVPGYSISIGQTGTIPISALSLTFWGYVGADDVSFNGQILSLTILGSTANYNIYGADISAFAGQTGQLLFTVLPYTGQDLIDNIQFSSTPVPEPSELALATLGAILFGFCRRKSPA